MKRKLKKSKRFDFTPYEDSKLKKVSSLVVQVILCVLLISVAFVISSSGFYIKPLLFIPIAICLAIFSEDELQSSLIGMVCGLLLDISYNKLIGFNGAILLVMCVFTTLIFKNYFKQMFFNALISVSMVTFIQGLLDYFFYYKIWTLNSTDNVSLIFENYIFPSCIMTIVSIIVIYPIVKSIRVNIKR